MINILRKLSPRIPSEKDALRWIQTEAYPLLIDLRESFNQFVNEYNLLTQSGLARLAGGNTFTGVQVMTNPELTTPVIGGVSTAGVTGTGNVVLNNSPALVSPSIGSATGTSLGTTGAITSSGGGIGYVAGTGGTVTQLSSKATGVTLDKLCGVITMNAAALGADTTQSFVLTNSFIDSDDFVDVRQTGALGTATRGGYNFSADPAVGSVTISVRNVTPGSLSEAVLIRFMVWKASTT